MSRAFLNTRKLHTLIWAVPIQVLNYTIQKGSTQPCRSWFIVNPKTNSSGTMEHGRAHCTQNTWSTIHSTVAQVVLFCRVGTAFKISLSPYKYNGAVDTRIERIAWLSSEYCNANCSFVTVKSDQPSYRWLINDSHPIPAQTQRKIIVDIVFSFFFVLEITVCDGIYHRK